MAPSVTATLQSSNQHKKKAFSWMGEEKKAKKLNILVN
jgi:hypothetical protein